MSSVNARAKFFHVLHKPSPDNSLARRVNYLLAFLITANAIFVALESVAAIEKQFRMQFAVFEAASTAIFVVEYIARLWVCVEQGRFSHPLWGRIRYAVQPLPLLDLIVIATFAMPVDLRFLRVARMVRLLKVLRLYQFEESLARIALGLQRRKALMVVAVTMMLISVYVASALLYLVEHPAQPLVFSSIPATFWWAIETLTTIGYGDMIPLTPLGKFFAGLISVFGIGVFALPTAIVTAAIVEAGVSDPEPGACIHCGKPQVHDQRSEQG